MTNIMSMHIISFFWFFLANYICAIKQEKKTHIFAIVLISKERTHYQDKIYTIILSLVK